MHSTLACYPSSQTSVLLFLTTFGFIRQLVRVFGEAYHYIQHIARQIYEWTIVLKRSGVLALKTRDYVMHNGQMCT